MSLHYCGPPLLAVCSEYGKPYNPFFPYPFCPFLLFHLFFAKGSGGDHQVGVGSTLCAKKAARVERSQARRRAFALVLLLLFSFFSFICFVQKGVTVIIINQVGVVHTPAQGIMRRESPSGSSRSVLLLEWCGTMEFHRGQQKAEAFAAIRPCYDMLGQAVK